MKILITGAAGDIGSTLVPYLREKFTAADIHCYDNLMYNQGPLTYNSFRNTVFNKEDVLHWSPRLNEDIKTADVIIPLAAIVGAPACDKVPSLSTDINYGWFTKFVKKVNSNALIIYPNTNSGYGSTGSDVCTEETPSNPISLYGIDKQNTENILL